MKISIKEAKQISNDIFTGLDMGSEEANLITETLIDAELSDRKTHGLIRLLGQKKSKDAGKLNTDPFVLDVISQSDSHLYINGHNKLGLGVIRKSLELALKKVKKNKLLVVGIKDVAVSGYIGAYARLATKHDLIFIGFNNSPGGLIPYGSVKEMLGTNPLTIGIPTDEAPVLLDMASSQTTWGELLIAKNEGKQIKEGVALDGEGNPTTNPQKAMKGGLLPFAGHKGSGLAFIVELLGGALTGSGVGHNVAGGWGSFYTLIDPTLFRPLADFKKDVQSAIDELKALPKASGFSEILFAGERSAETRKQHLKDGNFEISDKLFSDLQNLLKDIRHEN